MVNRPRPAMRVAAALAALAVASCKSGSNEGSAGQGGQAQAAPSKITIGATLPLTGAEARIGGFFKEGYDLAFEEVKAKGGLDLGGKKVPVTLTLLDDTSTQATAVSLADRLINSDRVDFLLGTYASHLVQAQSGVAEQNKVPYVNGGGGASDIYRKGYKYLFGLIAPVELLGTTLMQWVDGEQKAGKLPKPARIALLWENTSHGQDFRKGVSEFAQKSNGGFTVAVDESFELNGKDFGALLGKVKAADAQLYLVDAHLPDYITMHRQYIAAGLCHPIESYGARGSEKSAVDALGKEGVSYVLSAVWWNAQVAQKNPQAKAFVDAFQARYKKAPEWFQALAYESARALFLAIEKAGTNDRDKVRDALASLDVPSLLPGGKLRFPADKGQQVQNSFVVQQNMPDGGAPIIFPADAATAQGVAPNPRCKR
ncbi:MAG: amino acid ABC transporter substrate-binding protein [Anaeromyxobacteraceae bacterium]